MHSFRKEVVTAMCNVLLYVLTTERDKARSWENPENLHGNFPRPMTRRQRTAYAYLTELAKVLQIFWILSGSDFISIYVYL